MHIAAAGETVHTFMWSCEMRGKHEEEKGLLGKTASQQVLQRHKPNVIFFKKPSLLLRVFFPRQ